MLVRPGCFAGSGTTPITRPKPARSNQEPARFSLAKPASKHPEKPQQESSVVLRVFEGIEGRRAAVDRAIAQAARGREFSPSELLALQARVYAFNQEVELVSRAVDKTVGAAKAALNTQV